MATHVVPEPTTKLPEYLTDPDSVLKDVDVAWRYGRAPDYSKTREFCKRTKTKSHEAGSLPELVENLVKNWEAEASFKLELGDWRTIDRPNYTFATNGGSPLTAEQMLRIGTYNTLLSGSDNQYYSAEHTDFDTSHKTFKRMMPVFAWEVLEVYSGPPQVVFRWRHWGNMKNDYVGVNDKGEKVRVKAHGGAIEIQGITIATINESFKIQRIETWYNPMDLFRQIAQKDEVSDIVANRNEVSMDEGECTAAQASAKVRSSCPIMSAGGTTAIDCPKNELLIERVLDLSSSKI